MLRCCDGVREFCAALDWAGEAGRRECVGVKRSNEVVAGLGCVGEAAKRENVCEGGKERGASRRGR